MPKLKLTLLSFFSLNLIYFSFPSPLYAQASMTFNPINKNINWHNSQVPSTSVTESYNYNSSTDTLTTTYTFNQSGLAALPPMMALAKSYGFPLNCQNITDTGFKSIFGPLHGRTSSTTLTCTLTGLKKYTASKVLGTGTVPPNLQTEINQEVDKIIAAGHFTPELLGPTMPGSSPMDAKGYILWYNPGDVHYFLSEVYPLLDSTRQQAIVSYLNSERTTYKPESMKGLPFWSGSSFVGASRNPYRTSSQVYGYWWDGEPDQGDTTWLSQGYFKLSGNAPIPNLYGLSRYYLTTNQTPTSTEMTAFTTIVTNQFQNADWATMYWKSGSWPEFSATSAVNQLFAGLVGYTRLAEKAQNQNGINLGYGLLARLAGLRVAMGKYQQYQIARGTVSLTNNPMSATQRNTDNENSFANFGDLFTHNFDSPIKDIRQITILDNTQVAVRNWSGSGGAMWESGGGNRNTAQVKNNDPNDYPDGWNSAKGPELLAFGYITPELGRLLKDFLPNEVAAITSIYAETQPAWYLAYPDQIIGIESNYSNPMDSWGAFMARAWVNGEDSTTLAKYADQSWFDRGDYFYLHKLAETAKAYKGWSWSDGPAPTPPTATPTPDVDYDNNGLVDYRDFLYFVTHFGQSLNILNFNKLVELIF